MAIRNTMCIIYFRCFIFIPHFHWPENVHSMHKYKLNHENFSNECTYCAYKFVIFASLYCLIVLYEDIDLFIKSFKHSMFLIGSQMIFRKIYTGYLSVVISFKTQASAIPSYNAFEQYAGLSAVNYPDFK